MTVMNASTDTKLRIEQEMGFVGIYFDYLFIDSVNSQAEAEQYVNKRDRERALRLAKIEVIAKSNSALAKICEADAHEISDLDARSAGCDFFEHAQEAKTALEFQIIENIKQLMPNTIAFKYGYYEAENGYLYNLREWDHQEAKRLGEIRYYQQLEQEKEIKRNLLAYKALKAMEGIKVPTSYDELLALPVETRILLGEMEDVVIDIVDCANDYIDGHTGGHHREIRDIFNCAKEGKRQEGCYADIYMNEDGSFNFDLNEHINSFAKLHSDRQ